MASRETPRGRSSSSLGVSLRRRGLLLVAAFLAADAAVAMAACSTSSPDGEGADATTETTTTADAAKDSPVVQQDSSVDAGKIGNCSPAKGACDIVLQDCPAQQECVVNAANGTECRKVESSQQLPIGRGCCPNNPTGNPCLPGLSCIGSPCVDGGPATTGRCSPACCTGDDQACGKSDPEGISGACDITIVDPDGGAPLHQACTYSQLCKPFGVVPCTAAQVCLVQDKVGSASCVEAFGNKTNRQPCTAANDCADGLECDGLLPDGGGRICRTVCLLPGSTSPFDASVEEGGPGKGGCPSGEKCLIQFSNRPSWFALCALDGG
jgi:hypothetical protein